jgi:hypothetical protein
VTAFKVLTIAGLIVGSVSLFQLVGYWALKPDENHGPLKTERDIREHEQMMRYHRARNGCAVAGGVTSALMVAIGLVGLLATWIFGS